MATPIPPASAGARFPMLRTHVGPRALPFLLRQRTALRKLHDIGMAGEGLWVERASGSGLAMGIDRRRICRGSS